jgi:hypothetical protein
MLNRARTGASSLPAATRCRRRERSARAGAKALAATAAAAAAGGGDGAARRLRSAGARPVPPAGEQLHTRAQLMAG